MVVDERMKRVVVTRPFIGICHMQLCAVDDATDDEILAVANAENPAGTEHGWTTVLRQSGPNQDGPVPCEQNKGRTHFLVSC
jgi:hypothetical protein